MAGLADFARMPTQRKVMVFAIAGAVIALIYYQMVWKSLSREVEAAESDHTSKLAMSGKLESDIPKYEQLKTGMTKLRHTLDAQESALPTEAELPAFFETLNRKVLESGVEVKSTERRAEAKVESFIRVPVEFEITGTFMQIKKFFASLTYHKRKAGAPAAEGDDGDHERIVSIDNLALNDPQVVNHELVLHAKFTATTYREEMPPAAPERAQAPAASPTGKPATKTMPPADTPAGAKARAEDAMDKDEKRTRNAPGNPAETGSDGSGSAKLKGGM
jgi:Tfp pilus assembly protein PilO